MPAFPHRESVIEKENGKEPVRLPPFRVSKRCCASFLRGISLRSAPRLSAYSGQFDACSAQIVFPTYMPREKQLDYIRAYGRELLRRAF